MALTFDFTHIDGYSSEVNDGVGYHKVGDDEYELSPVSNALIWHSLNTGIGKITEENAAEVYARIALVEHLYGPSLVDRLQPRPITVEDVRKHIGMVTNASFKDETRASFLKRHAAAFLDERKAEAQRRLEESRYAAAPDEVIVDAMRAAGLEV